MLKVQQPAGRVSGKQKITDMKTINILNPYITEKECTCMGEIWFIRKKLWKLAIMLGYDFSANVLTTRGLSFSNIIDNSEEINKVSSFLDRNNIKYKIELSYNGWDKCAIVSKSKSNIEIINNLYDAFYKANKK